MKKEIVRKLSIATLCKFANRDFYKNLKSPYRLMVVVGVLRGVDVTHTSNGPVRKFKGDFAARSVDTNIQISPVLYLPDSAAEQLHQKFLDGSGDMEFVVGVDVEKTSDLLGIKYSLEFDGEPKPHDLLANLIEAKLSWGDDQTEELATLWPDEVSSETQDPAPAKTTRRKSAE